MLLVVVGLGLVAVKDRVGGNNKVGSFMSVCLSQQCVETRQQIRC